MAGGGPSCRTARRGLAAFLLLPVLTMSACGREDEIAAAASRSAEASATALGLSTIAPADRAALPPVLGATLDGSSLDVASLRGKVVVLNNWASWCGPCQDELPVLSALASTAGRGAAFVGLDVKDTDEAARAMVSKVGVPYPSIVDRDGRTLATLPGVPPAALPSTLVIDRQGRVAARVVGAVQAGQLEPVLAELQREVG